MEECENGCIPCTAEILKLWLVKYNISTGGRGIAVVKATGAESASTLSTFTNRFLYFIEKKLLPISALHSVAYLLHRLIE